MLEDYADELETRVEGQDIQISSLSYEVSDCQTQIEHLLCCVDELEDRGFGLGARINALLDDMRDVHDMLDDVDVRSEQRDAQHEATLQMHQHALQIQNRRVRAILKALNIDINTLN